MSKKKLYIGAVLLGLFLCCASLLALQPEPKLYKEDITADKAFTLIQQNPHALFIDVRTPKEYADSHPKGAKLIPIVFEENGKRVLNESFVDQVASAVNNDYHKPIVLICRSGSRTKFAANLLAKKGFSQVYNIVYGIFTKGGWQDLQLPLEK